MDEMLMALEVGKGEVLADGCDLLLVPVGSVVYRACEAARQLREEGIEAAVVNPRFIKPLDSALLCSMAQGIGRVVTIEENILAGGFGSAVIELFQERELSHVKVLRIGIRDQFLDHGPQAVLREKCGLGLQGILERARSFLEGDVHVKMPVSRVGGPGESRATRPIS
jgi:1-deoxy-D-xylulose-5-phosphate synthase